MPLFTTKIVRIDSEGRPYMTDLIGEFGSDSQALSHMTDTLKSIAGIFHPMDRIQVSVHAGEKEIFRHKDLTLDQINFEELPDNKLGGEADLVIT